MPWNYCLVVKMNERHQASAWRVHLAFASIGAVVTWLGSSILTYHEAAAHNPSQPEQASTSRNQTEAIVPTAIEAVSLDLNFLKRSVPSPNEIQGAHIAMIGHVLRRDPTWLSEYLRNASNQISSDVTQRVLFHLSGADPTTFWQLLRSDEIARKTIAGKFPIGRDLSFIVANAVDGAPRDAVTMLFESEGLPDHFIDNVKFRLTNTQAGAMELLAAWSELPVNALSRDILHRLASKSPQLDQDVVDSLNQQRKELLISASQEQALIRQGAIHGLSIISDEQWSQFSPETQLLLMNTAIWSDAPPSTDMIVSQIRRNASNPSILVELVEAGHGELATQALRLALDNPGSSEALNPAAARLLAEALVDYEADFEGALGLLSYVDKDSVSADVKRLRDQWKKADPSAFKDSKPEATK
jgi:hypothetical protein